MGGRKHRYVSFFIQVAASIVVFFINNNLKTYGGNIAIEAYAIANTLIMIIVMIMVGLTQECNLL